MIPARASSLFHLWELVAVVFATASFQEGNRSVIFIQTDFCRRDWFVAARPALVLLAALASARQTRQSPRSFASGRGVCSARRTAGGSAPGGSAAPFRRSCRFPACRRRAACGGPWGRAARPACCSGSACRSRFARCGGLAPGAGDLAGLSRGRGRGRFADRRGCAPHDSVASSRRRGRRSPVRRRRSPKDATRSR